MRILGIALLAAASFGFLGADQATAQRVRFGVGPDGFGLSVGVGRRAHCHGPGCRRIPRGRYVTQRHRVWRDGFYDRVWVAPRYVTRYRCGRPYRACVSPGRYVRRWVPGCYEWRTERVWVDDGFRWSCGY